MKAWTRSLGWALWMSTAVVSAHAAGCSRPIQVPMAPVGLSVSCDADRDSGVYPSLLRELAQALDCQFQIQRVPRARLQKMFESGQADLLLPASASPARDVHGEFVPLVQVRASLLTLQKDGPVPRSLAELLAQKDYRLVVVRGFSFGGTYDNAMARLRAQRRLLEESDAAGVVRALRQGLAQGTVMATSIFIGTLVQEGEFSPLLKQLRIEPLEELGWSESGVYLSRQSLGESDRRHLRQGLQQMARTGRVWQLFNDHHPPGSLGGSIRPLP